MMCEKRTEKECRTGGETLSKEIGPWDGLTTCFYVIFGVGSVVLNSKPHFE